MHNLDEALREATLTPRRAALEVLRLRHAYEGWQAHLLDTDDDDRLVAIGRCLAELEVQMRRFDRVLGRECRTEAAA